MNGEYEFLGGGSPAKIRRWGDSPSADDDELFVRWDAGEPTGAGEDYIEMYLRSPDAGLVLNDIGDHLHRPAFCQKISRHCLAGSFPFCFRDNFCVYLTRQC